MQLMITLRGLIWLRIAARTGSGNGSTRDGLSVSGRYGSQAVQPKKSSRANEEYRWDASRVRCLMPKMHTASTLAIRAGVHPGTGDFLRPSALDDACSSWNDRHSSVETYTATVRRSKPPYHPFWRGQHLDEPPPVARQTCSPLAFTRPHASRRGGENVQVNRLAGPTDFGATNGGGLKSIPVHESSPEITRR